MFNANSEYSKIGEHLTTKKTPAVTIVAACIKAETGVGPSIASGNHVCKKSCADFPIAPTNKNKQIKSIGVTEAPKNAKINEKDVFYTDDKGRKRKFDDGR